MKRIHHCSFALVVALVITGCSSPSITRERLSSIRFGESTAGVQAKLGKDFGTSLRAATTNGLLEMRHCYSEDTHQHWYLLFIDEKFVSSRPLDGFTAWGAWPGFSNPMAPDFNQVTWFWKDFAPPEEPISRLSGTNLPSKEDFFARHQTEGMMIGMAPFLPFAVIVAPVLYAHERPMLNRIKSSHDIRPGMEAEKIAEFMGSPNRILGTGDRRVLSYSNPILSVGVEQGRVVFVFFDFDVAQYPVH